MKSVSPQEFWQTYFGFGLLIGLAALYQTLARILPMEVALWRSKWTFLIAAYALTVLGGGILMYGLHRGWARTYFERLGYASASPWRWLWLLPLLALHTAVPYVRIFVFGDLLPGFFPILWLFWWLSVFQAACWKSITRVSWAGALVFTVLFQGVTYQLYETFASVSTYPFSLGYSETSRFYYASLLFGRGLYGVNVPLSPWHPSRYFLLALPFFVQGLPLWIHRFWQAVLWVLLTGISSFLLARRLRVKIQGQAALIAAWFFLYSLQGAVYYHLHIAAIIILWGVQHNKPWRSLVAVLAASIWAGMSRVNWFPVPAMLATGLYLLEEPLSAYRNVKRYLARPALWGVLGVLMAFTGASLYIRVSGYPDGSAFRSSFNSAFLWNRLLPNDLFPPGILLGMVLVSLPLWLAIYFTSRSQMEHMAPIRWAGLLAMLVVLLGMGLVVSVKIGGGAELHNLDAYMVLLGMVAAFCAAAALRPEQGLVVWGRIPFAVVVLAVLIPFGFKLRDLGIWTTYNRAQSDWDLQVLQETLSPVAAQGGQILFISERHLLTFDMIHGVPLVAEHEMIELMEMAMSNNQPYLAHFADELHQHRFALIVSRKLNTGIKSAEPFAEENNAWNQKIALQILCEYDSILGLESNNLQVYAPKPGGRSCP